MARYSRSKSRARRTTRKARGKQSRLGLRMSSRGFRKARRKGRVHAKRSTFKKYRRMAKNPAQFPVPFVSALNPGRRTRRGRKSTRRSARGRTSKRTARKSWVRTAKAKTRKARRKARYYVGKHRAKSRRGGNSKRALNRALYHARGGRFSRKSNPRRGRGRARRNCGR